MTLPVIAVTSGEPAGIGPDICLNLAAHSLPCRPVVLGDKHLLAERAAMLGKTVRIRNYHPEHAPKPGTLEVRHIPLAALLDELGRRGINNALVEAGAGLAGAFLRAQLADEILYYLAPCLLGPDARPLAVLPPLADLSAKMQYTITDTTPLGTDLRLTLTPENPCSQAS